uniref:Discoidin, CUB and LCCL domain-containing protein 1-like protein n=1 Tax=Callorhinchus milii TaxID=7868 RepID=V9KKT9_CALMI
MGASRFGLHWDIMCLPPFHLFLLFAIISTSPTVHRSAAQAQEGDGCGHTVLGAHSGTLTSKNYPGTYPNHTRCRWELRVSSGSNIIVKLGDLDLEYTEHCASSSLQIFSPSMDKVAGTYCGNFNTAPRELTLNSSHVTVEFRSVTHISGRGFLLSYSTDNNPDLISCLDKGIHYSQPRFTVYCPAGCQGVSGEIWGNNQPGYRDTSVLCKAAIHAGAIADGVGGRTSLALLKGVTLYEAALANGILTRMGALSEKRILVRRDCDEALEAVNLNASSSWRDTGRTGGLVVWSPDRARTSSEGHPPAWAARKASRKEWLQIDLGERKNITGIVTTGTGNNSYNYYVKSYKISYSRDGRNWRMYKSRRGKEEKVFEGNRDCRQQARNNFLPPFISRYIRINPQTWSQRISLKAVVLGCDISPRPRSAGFPRSPKPLPKPTSLPKESSTPADHVVIEKHLTGFNLMVICVVVGAVLIVSAAVLTLHLCWKKRKTGAEMDRPSPKVYAQPDVVQAGRGSAMAGPQKPSLTFQPLEMDDGYTVPLAVDHYDVPFSGRGHEYASPLPNQEPEYATPFVERTAESEPSTKKSVCVVKVIPSLKAPAAPEAVQPQYDSPAQRLDRTGALGHPPTPPHNAPPATVWRQNPDQNPGDRNRANQQMSPAQDTSTPVDAVLSG